MVSCTRASILGLVSSGLEASCSGLGDDLAHRHARIERGQRILEDDLQVAPLPCAVALSQADEVLAQPDDRAVGRLDADAGWRGRGSTCRSRSRPTMPSVSPGVEVEETPSTALTALVAPAQQPRPIGKVHLEVADAEQRSSGIGGPYGVTRWQAAARPPAPRCSAGGSAVQRSNRTAQRGANGQPPAGAPARAGCLESCRRSCAVSSSSRGVERQQALRIGMARRRTDRRSRPSPRCVRHRSRSPGRTAARSRRDRG